MHFVPVLPFFQRFLIPEIILEHTETIKDIDINGSTISKHYCTKDEVFH